MRKAQRVNPTSAARPVRLAADRFVDWAASGSSRLNFLRSFLILVLSCSVARSEESSAAALTLDSERTPARATSLLSDNFSISVTLDLPPDDSGELVSGNSIGYRRVSVSSTRHVADPDELASKFVLFRKPVQPGLASLAWGNFQTGYGRVFYDDSVIVRGNNGTVWEEPGCLYLKARFRF